MKQISLFVYDVNGDKREITLSTQELHVITALLGRASINSLDAALRSMTEVERIGGRTRNQFRHTLSSRPGPFELYDQFLTLCQSLANTDEWPF